MSYLTDLVASRRSDVQREKALLHAGDRKVLERLADERADPRSFADALSGGSAIIAEFKRRSPSAGIIRETDDAGAVVRGYAQGGAAAISVLTEPRYFHGSFQDLAAARKACSLPILCKDFVVDEYQVLQAAAAGADAVLLIVAALSQEQLRNLMRCAQTRGLDSFVEVHAEREVAAALDAGARLIGINNRDLGTFLVDTTTALRLRPLIPDDRIVVAESGYKDAGAIQEAFAHGVHAVLVGEALMRANDPASTVAGYRGRSMWPV